MGICSKNNEANGWVYQVDNRSKNLSCSEENMIVGSIQENSVAWDASKQETRPALYASLLKGPAIKTTVQYQGCLLSRDVPQTFARRSGFVSSSRIIHETIRPMLSKEPNIDEISLFPFESRSRGGFLIAHGEVQISQSELLRAWWSFSIFVTSDLSTDLSTIEYDLHEMIGIPPRLCS